ncbi:hypothetical protein ACT453_52695, partial [Bacillus sp. D-CC]
MLVSESNGSNKTGILFAEAVAAEVIMFADPVLQQIEQTHDLSISTNDAFRAVSKYWDRINRPEQLMTAMIQAMRVLT